MANRKYYNDKLISVLNDLMSEELGKTKSDAFALYYAYSKYQWKNQLSTLKIPDAARVLGISCDRVRRARRTLLNLSLITLKTQPDDEGVVRHYVRVKEL